MKFKFKKTSKKIEVEIKINKVVSIIIANIVAFNLFGSIELVKILSGI